MDASSLFHRVDVPRVATHAISPCLHSMANAMEVKRCARLRQRIADGEAALLRAIEDRKWEREERKEMRE